MKNIESKLKDLEKLYYVAIKNAKMFQTNNLQGSLVVKECNGSVQFFHQTYNPEKSKYQRKYLKADDPIINLLLQKSYFEKILKLANKRYYHIKHFNKNFNIDEIDLVYQELDDIKKSRIKPVFPTWERRLAKWKSIPFDGLDFPASMPKLYSKKGERVRSKTEKIIADMLFDNNVEYKYECPLYLDDEKVVYPDFTFLKPGTRQEIYWEHFGMMQDKEYVIKTMAKIEKYEENGIYLGDRLLITFESDRKGMNFKRVNDLIYRYLK